MLLDMDIPSISEARRERKKNRPRAFRFLVRRGLKDRRFFRLYILGLLLFYCTVFYYAGEIIDYFNWDPLRWDIFYAVHDVHRLLFLIPILYAAYAFGIRATIIITLVSGGIWIPRAVFFSPYPSPLLRAMLFLVFEGALGFLTSMTLQQNRRLQKLEENMEAERNRLLAILKRMTDGVIVVGPDYKVRYTNEAMKSIFGEGLDMPCYKYIYHYVEPCEHCRLPRVLKGTVERWEYQFPDGVTYEVVAAPFIDSDGVGCQLASYRDITHHKRVQTLNS